MLVLLLSASPAVGASDDPVVLQDNGPSVVLSNGLISITVNKDAATIPAMTFGNSPNLAGRGGYFAVANSMGRDAGDVHNAEYKAVRNTTELVELSFGCQVGGVHFTLYYVLRRGEQGFYVSVLEQRRPGDPPEQTGQARWSFYLNESVFNYQLASDTEQGPIPNLVGAEPVQDATFRLKDGTVYTKYNYCTYVEEDYVHGLCGTNAGGYGAFVVNPSHEWLQAPTKQYITVHAIPILHQMLQTGHFIPRELASQSIPEGWTKFCGPWFVYLNQGDTRQQIWADAKARAEKEKAQWPYPWMQHPDYPLQRGEVSGTLKLYDGNQPAANALMVLTAPQPDWQVQVFNYIFSVRADGNGHFVIPQVRPGKYTLFAAVPGVTDEFRKDNISVVADGNVDLGTMVFTPAFYSAKLWEIGFADRRTTGFRLSDQPRQYGLDKTVPADLTYTVGRSDPSRDWYYCQAKPGDWTVNFNMDRACEGQGVLTIGIAGQTSDPILQVLVNSKPVGTYAGGNSSASYRSAILGSSYYENKILRFPASLLHPGTNTVTLGLETGSVMYDVVKLEIDDPNIPKHVPAMVAAPIVMAQSKPMPPALVEPAAKGEAGASQGRVIDMQPDLGRLVEWKDWRIVNRSVSSLDKDRRKGVRFDEGNGIGLAWLQRFTFTDGTIEFDARGTNVLQKSFLGVVFHGFDEKTYDAVYFRPFNFTTDDPVRRNHAVQYISQPTYTWQKLRQEQPEKYEKPLVPAPDPNGWFHVRVEVAWPKVSVFVNGAREPSLVVDQLSERKSGWIGFWVDVGGGEFANLRIR